MKPYTRPPCSYYAREYRDSFVLRGSLHYRGVHYMQVSLADVGENVMERGWVVRSEIGTFEGGSLSEAMRCFRAEVKHHFLTMSNEHLLDQYLAASNALHKVRNEGHYSKPSRRYLNLLKLAEAKLKEYRQELLKRTQHREPKESAHALTGAKP